MSIINLPMMYLYYSSGYANELSLGEAKESMGIRDFFGRASLGNIGHTHRACFIGA